MRRAAATMQVESMKGSSVQRQEQLDREAAELQQQQVELTQRLSDFQTRVLRTEAALQEREAALGDLQVTGGRAGVGQCSTNVQGANASSCSITAC